MGLNWARRPAPSRHRGEAVVVVDRHENEAVVRENEPLWAAAAAVGVEIGLAPGAARRRRQLAAEIVKRVAADHMAGPRRAQPAAAPAMRPRLVLRCVARRQALRPPEALHGVDKRLDLAQSHALCEG